MQRLNQFLEPLMRRLDLYQPSRERMALLVWPDIVGPYVAPNTAAVGIKRGVLFVRTASSAWMTELSVGYRRAYIEKINHRLGEELVRDIRFLPPPLPAPDPEGPLKQDPLALQPLMAEDEALIEEIVSTVEAPEMRHRLRRLMRRDLALRRARQQAGWRPCPHCRVLTRDGGACTPCVDQARRVRLAGIRRTLLRAPWTSPVDIRLRFSEATLQEYQLVKAHLLKSLKTSLYEWSRRASADAKLSGEMLGKALRYCMLRFGKRPHELDRRDITWALGRSLAAHYPG